MQTRSALFDKASDWLCGSPIVESAVLFGSTVQRLKRAEGALSEFSDFDFHVVTRRPKKFEEICWSNEIADERFCLRAVRPASGGVRKLTILFESGQVEIVVVPYSAIQLAQLGLRLKVLGKVRILESALNEMATCLHSGYLFIKNERRWGSFYRAAFALPGVRLSDAEIERHGEVFVCDLLWMLQKITEGELIAAQHCLHSRILEWNLKLWRETRQRTHRSLPSFGLGRKVELVGSETERLRLSVNSQLTQASLISATLKAQAAFENFMGELIPKWGMPPCLRELLLKYGVEHKEFY